MREGAATPADSTMRHALLRREFIRRAAHAGLLGPALARVLPAGVTGMIASAQAEVATARPVGRPRRGGTMVVLGHQEVSGLSPDDTGPTIQWVVIVQIHNALLQFDTNWQLRPVLAESYSVTPDGTAYTFRLRRSVRFHDGTEFTSEDVKYTYDYYRDPKNAAVTAAAFDGIDSVETPDRYTVVVRMRAPKATFLSQTATYLIVPAHYHSRVGEKAYRTAPIGTGAFKLREWIPADHTTVEAFDGHFRGRPYLEAFREDIVPEASVRAIALETGKADASVWALLVADSLRLATDPRFHTVVTTDLAMNHIALNNKRPQFSDRRVRQAMMYAIDRKKLITDIFKGTATLATANISPALRAWYDPNVRQYPYDPAKAGALLDEAGWTIGSDGIRARNGVRLSFTCSVLSGDQVRVPETEVIQQQRRAVGIEMKIRQEPVTAYLTGMRKGDRDAANFNWTYGGANGDPDASNTLGSHGGNNFCHFRNARMDRLLAEGLRQTDPRKRRPIYDEIQRLFAEEVPSLYLMHWHSFNTFSRRIKGIPQSITRADGVWEMTHRLWIEE